MSAALNHDGRPKGWSPEDYARHGGFVPAFGGDIVKWLAPRPGESILDLGCGDGALTLAIIEAGAHVVGVDASAEMVTAARARGIEAEIGDGEKLRFNGEFDAVFSNAALHWMTNPVAVAQSVCRALKPGGRFVAEFGGHANVAAIATALQASTGQFGGDPDRAFPWYFPTEAEYEAVLADAGLTLQRSALVHRPTPLPTDMAGWLETFANGFLDQYDGKVREEVIDYVVKLLERSLRDSAGQWTADYVRLRIEARRAA